MTPSQRHRDEKRRRGQIRVIGAIRGSKTFSSRAARSCVQTNPISGGRPRPQGPVRAKQSQLPPDRRAGPLLGQPCETNPIPAGSVAEIPHYSTILSFHHPNPMPIAQNEANFWTMPGEMEPRGRRAWGVLQTNPISAVPAAETACRSTIPSFQHSNPRPQARKQSCENKANSTASVRGGKYCVEKEL